VCGIAGYSLDASSEVDRTLTAQALLAGIADRGSDAAGYAYATPGEPTQVFKLRAGASALLEQITVPAGACSALLHVRDFTKGHPSLDANNHPIRHAGVVGIHNGIIGNDDEIFARHDIERAEEGMTVDSEVIFALVARYGHGRGRVLEELYGSMAAAWLDEAVPDALYLVRGVGRPLWIGRGRRTFLFASTRSTLELAQRYTGLKLRLSEVDEGRLLTVVDGQLEQVDSFEPDRSFEKAAPPAVRAPEEHRRCLVQLNALAALS
jgi:glucosamine 6-phosphate synthetase-like amidotransferase/phosphosugar isomerase protein